VSGAQFGPRQQQEAKKDAESLWLWGLDAVKAVEAGDVVRVAKLAQVLEAAAIHLTDVARRAGVELCDHGEPVGKLPVLGRCARCEAAVAFIRDNPGRPLPAEFRR
jgi:hypothetical protein